MIALVLAWVVVVLVRAPDSSAASCPAGQPCIVVTEFAGAQVMSTQVVTGADLNAWGPDVVSTQYYTRAYPGQALRSEPGVPSGVSVQELLAHTTTGTATYLEIATRGQTTTLSRRAGELARPGEPGYPFDTAYNLVPAFWFRSDSADAMAYVRPLRASTDDVNASDNLQTDVKGQLDVAVHTTGTVVTPAVTASPRSTTAGGTPVTFTANSDDPDRTERLHYLWTYGDGAQSGPGGRTATHSYSTPGTYYAYVTVAGSHGSIGQSSTVPITVKPAPTSTSPSTTPTPTPTSTPATGPSRGNGPSGNPIGGPTAGHGHQGGGAPQTSDVVNSTAAGHGSVTEAGTPATSTNIGSFIRSGAPTTGAPAPGAASGSSSRSAARLANGADRVDGYLIVGLAGKALPAGAAPSSSHAPLTAPAARAGVAAHRLAVWAFGVLAVLALLAAGAYTERRPPRRTHG